MYRWLSITMAWALSCVFFSDMVYAKVFNPKSVDSIEMWKRSSGNHADNGVEKKLELQKFFKSKMKLSEVESKDHQYDGKAYKYRAISLPNLVAMHPAHANQSLVLLHFQNGMQIAIESLDLQKFKNVYLAWEIEVEKKWTSEFPEIPKKDEELRDPRPIRFHSNKIVSPDGFFPALGEDSRKNFSPWSFTDTLFAIEFANADAYRRQFAFESTEAASKGLAVFEKRCSYCHGVYQVGASFGWDFVDPLPIYKQKTAAQLMNHVKFPKWDALPRGLMMPAQKGTTSEEMEYLWQWMKSAAGHKLRPYKT